MSSVVYWTAYSEGDPHGHMDLIFENIPRLSKEMDHIKDSVVRCPSFLKEIKNTYVVKAPFDFTLEYSIENQCWMAHVDEASCKVGQFGLEGCYVQMHNILSFILFSEDKDLEVKITPAFLHQIPAPSVVGSYNISKWFRNISGAFMFDLDKKYYFKKDYPMWYFTFNNPVRFKRYYMNNDLYIIRDTLSMMKFYRKGKPLSYLYSIFLNAKYNKRILKIIKENLV